MNKFTLVYIVIGATCFFGGGYLVGLASSSGEYIRGFDDCSRSFR